MQGFAKFKFSGDNGAEIVVNVEQVRFASYENNSGGRWSTALVFDNNQTIVVDGDLKSVWNTLVNSAKR